jgi:hypothetical protein
MTCATHERHIQGLPVVVVMGMDETWHAAGFAARRPNESTSRDGPANRIVGRRLLRELGPESVLVADLVPRGPALEIVVGFPALIAACSTLASGSDAGASTRMESTLPASHVARSGTEQLPAQLARTLRSDSGTDNYMGLRIRIRLNNDKTIDRRDGLCFDRTVYGRGGVLEIGTSLNPIRVGNITYIIGTRIKRRQFRQVISVVRPQFATFQTHSDIPIRSASETPVWVVNDFASARRGACWYRSSRE